MLIRPLRSEGQASHGYIHISCALTPHHTIPFPVFIITYIHVILAAMKMMIVIRNVNE